MDSVQATSHTGHLYLQRAAGALIDPGKYDPKNAEECVEMWREYAQIFIDNHPQFKNSQIVVATDPEVDGNYILGLTAENEDLNAELEDYIELMFEDDGPLAGACFILHGDNYGVPEGYDSELGFAFITLY